MNIKDFYYGLSVLNKFKSLEEEIIKDDIKRL